MFENFGPTVLSWPPCFLASCLVLSNAFGCILHNSKRDYPVHQDRNDAYTRDVYYPTWSTVQGSPECISYPVASMLVPKMNTLHRKVFFKLKPFNNYPLTLESSTKSFFWLTEKLMMISGHCRTPYPLLLSFLIMESVRLNLTCQLNWTRECPCS